MSDRSDDPQAWDQPARDLFTDAENARLEAAGYRHDGGDDWLTPDGRHTTREQALRRLDAQQKRED